MSLSIQEKYSELKEELNGKNPFVKYNLLREELDKIIGGAEEGPDKKED